MFVNRSFDETVENLKRQYHDLETQVESANQRLADFRKDEEIVHLDAKIKELSRNSLLMLSGTERESIDAFKDEHYQRHKGDRRSGSSYIYKLTGTGVGTCIEITCPLCGETKDVTDISSW